MLVAQSCTTLCDPMACSPSGSSICGILQNTGGWGGCHALLQGIFLTQGSNRGLLHCRQILLSEPLRKPYVFIYLYIHSSIISIHPFIHPSIYPCDHPPFIHPSTHPSIHLFFLPFKIIFCKRITVCWKWIKLVFSNSKLNKSVQ